MITKKAIKDEISELESLQVLTKAYGEIASARMKRARDSVLMNRDFQEEINSIFNDVRTAYMQEVLAKGGKTSGKSVTFLAHNGKKVIVLLSANTGFYGDIIRETYRKFLKEAQSQDAEVTVVGKIGLSMLLSDMPSSQYTFFEIPDHDVKPEHLTDIIKHLVQYEEISVHYGLFQSVLVQKPTRTDVSAETPIDIGKKEYTHYLFEPSIEEILVFFEKQLFASYFSQTVRESQLSKFASRILAMNRAEESIRESLGKNKIASMKLHHRIAGRKQTESLASMNLWRK